MARCGLGSSVVRAPVAKSKGASAQNAGVGKLEIRLSEQEIFEIAVDLAPGKLGPFLDQHCADRPAVRLRIERLLEVHRKSHLLDHPIASLIENAGSTLDAFRQALEQGERPEIESWLQQIPPREQEPFLRLLIAKEMQFRRRAGEDPTFEEYRLRFPQLQFPESPKPSDDPATKSLKLDQASEATKEFILEENVLPTLAIGADEGVGGVLAGKYKLVEAIGEGGMGSVFLSQQIAPVKRLVAVKIIKAGMDSKSVLARFDAERQALAMMDHPNIAKVLDAGTTERLRPFFVMELVKGVPITKFCDDRQLDIRGRISLLISVCHAIQHAHQKGVIHRDIKPSNVLVATYDDVPVAKVIDFGLAKATGHQLTEATLVTGLGSVVGTPEYMSPEQASFNQLDIDTRTDVYSLGVLLFELLTGTTPVNRKTLKSAALLEILRIVREVDAPLASSRLSSSATIPAIAAKRGTDPRRLSLLLRGDLDWITSKSLEKERSRRYESAGGLAQDLERFLANEMVEARPPSSRYRFQKIFLRNKGIFLATATVMLVLLIGVIGTSIGLYRAVAAEKLIETEHEKTLKALSEANIEKGKAEIAAESEKTAAAKERKAAEREALASKQARVREQEAKAQAVRANTTAYSAQLSAVESHLRQGNFPAAFRVLDACAWEPRNWEYDWLASRVLKQGRLLTGHTKPVKALVFSTDGKTLLSGSDDCTVKAWDVISGQEKLNYRGHIQDGTGISFIRISPSDDRVLTLGWDGGAGELNVWSLKSGETTLVERGFSNPTFHFGWSYSGDGNRIALVDRTRPKFWNAETGEKLDFKLPALQFEAAALNEDGSLIAACEVGAEGLIGVWTLPEGKELFCVRKPSKITSYSKLIFNSLRMHVLCVDDRGMVDILDAKSGELIAQLPGAGSVQFSVDEKLLARRKENRLIVYDTEIWKERFSIPDARLFHFSPDSQEVFTFHEDGFFGVRSYLTSNSRRTRSIPLDRSYLISAAISPQSDWLAIATDDNELWLISLRDIESPPHLAGPYFNNNRPSGEQQKFAIDPDGEFVAQIEPGHSDKGDRILLWDVQGQRYRENYELAAPQGVKLESVAWTDDGKKIVAGGEETVEYPLPTKDYGGKTGYRQGVVTMWDVATSRQVSHCRQAFSKPPQPLEGRPWELGLGEKLQYSAIFVVADFGKDIAWTLDEAQCLAQWNLKSGACTQIHKKLAGVSGRVERAAFSKDASSVAMRVMPYNAPPGGGETKPVMGIWDLKTGRLKLEVPSSMAKRISTLAVSDDGHQFAFTDEDSSNNPLAGGIVHLWRVDSPTVSIHCIGHKRPIVKLAFSADGERLATASKDGTTRIWSTKTGQLMLSLESGEGPSAIAFGKSGSVLTCDHKVLWKWQAPKNQLPRTYFGHTNSSTPGVMSVAWSPKGDQLVSVSALEMRSWNPKSGDDFVKLPIESGQVRGAAFSPDGSRVATRGAGVSLRDPLTLQVQQESKIHFHEVTGVDFSTSGDDFYSAGGQKHIVQWSGKDLFVKMVLGNGPIDPSDVFSLVSSRTLKQAHAHDSIVIAISPNAMRLASASERDWSTGEKTPPQLKLWDLESNKEIACVPTGDPEHRGWGGRVYCIAWSPDGNRLFAANRDGDIWVYDSTSLQTLAQWKGHVGQVFALAVEPRSQRLASGGEDGSVRLWNLQDGVCSQVLRSHQKAVRGLAFSPEGRELASASDDGTVKIWNVVP